MPHTINPIQYYEVTQDQTLVFLAGPIRGARNWRDRAIELISAGADSENLVFASPDRVNDRKLYTPGHEDFVSRQRQWELYYLRKAIEKSKEGKGIVLFWLEEQSVPLAEEDGIQGKSFGAITHLELGQIMVTHSDAIVAGIHPDYNERSTIINDLRQSKYLDLSIPFDPKALSDIIVSDTLEDVSMRTRALLKL